MSEEDICTDLREALLSVDCFSLPKGPNSFLRAIPLSVVSLSEMLKQCDRLQIPAAELAHATPQYIVQVGPIPQASSSSAFFAFHGSPTQNWLSIITHGLGDFSGAAAQRVGVYGQGVYLSTSLGVSTDFSQSIRLPPQHRSWSSLRVIGVFEVRKGPEVYLPGSYPGEGNACIPPHYVLVRDTPSIALRYLLLFVTHKRRGPQGRVEVFWNRWREPLFMALFALILLLSSPSTRGEIYYSLPLVW